MDRKLLFFLSLILVMLAATGAAPTSSSQTELSKFRGPQGNGGAVFVMTNSTNGIRGNEIVMYDRSDDGDLTLVGYFPTGNLIENEPQSGSGPAPTAQIFNLATEGALPFVSAQFDGLGSNNSLILNATNRCLFAVNAGNNSISAFQVQRTGLKLVNVVDSGGVFPASLTEDRRLLYVVNSGDEGSLAGFDVSSTCRLTSIGEPVSLADWTETFGQPAPGEVLTSPAQLSFTPDGRRLVLSIKGLSGADFDENGNLLALPNGRILVFPVANNGSLGEPTSTELSFSGGTGGPFSFDFVDNYTIVAVHANSGTVASYSINPDSTLTLVGSPHPVSAFAPCWLDITDYLGRGFNRKRFAYAVSFGAPSGVLEILGAGAGLPDANGVIFGFEVNNDGSLTDLEVAMEFPDPSEILGVEASGNHGIDILAIDRYLYFIQPRVGRLGRLTIRPDGDLVDLVNFGGLAPGLEPFDGLNAGVNDFVERCFRSDLADPAPECALGSAQGITGY